MDGVAQTSYPIRDWASEERPRERLMKYGPQALRTNELIAILLRTGSRGMSAMALADRLMREFRTLAAMRESHRARWEKIKGIGQAKYTQLAAAFELGIRLREERAQQSGTGKIRGADDVMQRMGPRLAYEKKETFSLLLLDARNCIIDIACLTRGTVNCAYPIMRELFDTAFRYHAASLICVHNHPSGETTPSPEDKRFTHDLIRAAAVLGIRILDHVIIAGDRYFSFADQGMLV